MTSNTATKLGIILAIIFGCSFFSILIKSIIEEKKSTNDIPDERQKILRGTGYKIGFWTLVILYLIIIILEALKILNGKYKILFSIGAIFLSIQVFITYVIFKGADITPKSEKNPEAVAMRYRIFFTEGFFCLLYGIIQHKNVNFVLSLIWFFGGEFLMYCAIIHYLKVFYDKKHRLTEDSED